MKTVEQLYNEMKHLPVEEQNRLLKEHAAYLQTLKEEERMMFYESFMDSLENSGKSQSNLAKM